MARENTETVILDNAVPNSNNKVAILRQVTAAVIVNILSICNGLSAGWTSPVQTILQSSNNPVSSDPVTDDTFSWASSVLYLGGFVGSLVWNDFADRFGRKINGYIIAATQFFGWLGIILAREPVHLCWARFLMGIGGSGIIINSALYINETAGPELKGSLSCLLIVFMNAGILLVNLLGFLFSYETLNFICFSITLTFIIFFLWLPESPLYLLAKDHPSDAKKALLWYRGNMESEATLELSALRQSLDAAKSKNRVPYRELLSTKDTTIATIVVVVLLTGQQLSGLSIVLAYTVEILRLAGATESATHQSTVIVYLLLVIASAFSGSVLNFVNKKLILFFTFLGAFFSFVLLFLFYYVMYSCKWESIEYFMWVPTVSLIMYILCYSIGVGPVPYAMFPNMFPPQILNNAISVSLMLSILTAFGTVKLFPYMQKSRLGDAGTFFVFAVNNLLLSLFVLIFVTEPKKPVVSTNNFKNTVNF